MSRDRRSSSYACAAAVFTLFSVSASWAQTPGPLNAITDVPGIEVGQYTSTDATSGGGTGTTVVVSRAGAVGGVSQRGGAPGTRETDLLRPENLVEKVNAVVLSGGSAYGLAAADGISVGASVAVNSSGRTFDTEGNFYAGFLELGNEFPLAPPTGADVVPPSNLLQNTTIAVVATSARLTKAQATKVAQMADDGLAR